MPRGDMTGPLGSGPRTGRGLGYCAGYSYPGYMNPYGYGWGRGFGRGWRRGLGVPGWWGYRYPVQPSTAEEEKEILLSEELKALKGEMKAIEERIKELGTKKKK
jgi:hypothetical protein